MSESYGVRVSKDFLVFTAAHFITFGESRGRAGTCERLHGHNYRVSAEIRGALDENHYVIDFVLLRDTLKQIVDELDQHMLLPTQHPQIRVAAGAASVEVAFQDRRWEFPRGDCILLPVPNTTTEMLAHHIGRILLDRLSDKVGSRPQWLRIEVDECEGQSAFCEFENQGADSHE